MKVKSGLAEEFLKFNDRSRSPYHAASGIAEILKSAGFQRISEADDWATQLKPKGRYYFTREASSIVAFALDGNFGDKNLAFALIGAHTDSPCFKVKPISKCVAYGYNQLGVECYGGGLWHTWFDRDLTVAGRVAIRRKGSETLEMKLVSVQRPILRIPNLAIHLQRNIYSEGVKINKETHTFPILATEIQNVLNGVNGTNSFVGKNEEGAGSDQGKNCPPGLAGQRHAPILLDILAQELNVDVSEIVDLDLCVADTQPSAIGGAVEEFVFAPRLDNLVSCFTSAKALINSLDESSAGQGSTVRVISLFDHEEVGSDSSHGAGSPLVTDTMQRIAEVCDTSFHRAIRRSMLVSADMAHALHPNYCTAHEVRHRPKMGAGLVIKTNQNQRYATSGITGLIMREAARRGGNIPIQEFVVPNDKPCGSTIGPIVSSNTGLRTVDVGQAQLAMHSVREMCAVGDFELAERLFRAFFTHFRAIDEELAGTAEL